MIQGTFMNPKSKVKTLRHAMQNARSFAEWYSCAQALDKEEGNEKWRTDEPCEFYNSERIGTHIKELKECIRAEEPAKLLKHLRECSFHDVYEISNPSLYDRAFAGTKHQIEEYLREYEVALHWLSQQSISGLSTAEFLKLFERENRIYGRPALVMGGGATMGIYNLGVVKALVEQDLLPEVVSGSSMGSYVAAIIGSRTQQELLELLNNPEQLKMDAIRMLSPYDIVGEKVILDGDKLHENISTNVGTLTFAEAYQKSRITINVTVSPLRHGQRPRMLSHLTTPDVLIADACRASCAIPGFFPPANLRSKDNTGKVVPYMEKEKWVDGSIYQDIPLQSLGRLHNVKFSIVSQSNPFVLPFMVLSEHDNQLIAITRQSIISSAKFSAASATQIAGNLVNSGSLRAFLRGVTSLIGQNYVGDVTIRAPAKLSLYKKLLTNPNEDALKEYSLLGQQATWPFIPRIRNQLRIHKAIDEAEAKMRRRLANEQAN
jgi:TAG lipase/steryl ester hydrolase/phospholipase A2/LPA acyltransferase